MVVKEAIVEKYKVVKEEVKFKKRDIIHTISEIISSKREFE